ncbi:UNVERIFIED_CONTAM: stage II sporulation protein P [Murimonas intestini]|uniref:Stage II sporulation protein P n=3 Tax=Murimonas intestini TaxID=1337051 RepID=A0AB73T1X6_9FIRM
MCMHVYLARCQLKGTKGRLCDWGENMKHMQKLVRMVIWTGIFAVGTYILIRGIGIMEDSGFLDIHSLIEKMSVDTYMAGLTYEEPGEDKNKDWVQRIIGEQFPVYDYVRNYLEDTKAIESSPEYQMMVEAEGEDSRLQDGHDQLPGHPAGDGAGGTGGQGAGNGNSGMEGQGAGNENHGTEGAGAGNESSGTENPGAGTESSGTEGTGAGTESSGTEGTGVGTEGSGTEGTGAGTEDSGTEGTGAGTEDSVTENPGAGTESQVTEAQSPDTESPGMERPDAETEKTGSDTQLADASQSNMMNQPGGMARQPIAEVPMDQLQNFDYLLNNFFTVDMTTTIDSSRLNLDSLMGKDLSISEDNSKPQILIYHTHSQEGFTDSVPGDTGTTIVGVGEHLAELLRDKYGFNVIHHTAVYDMIDGVLDRNKAYNLAAPDIQSILDTYPSIEVVIDLHRDGVDGYRFVTDIDGKPTARIMFFNGLSYSAETGDIDYLPNPYVQDNLAFSFQLQLKAAQYYPGFTRNIYLKSLRFNLHMRPRSLLIESGTQLNTVEEEMNAMEPLADILNQVLRGE